MNSIYDKLTTLDFIIVGVYLAALLIIGYVVSVKQSKKNETLFLAGNSLKWYSIGFNMWGTNVGPSSLLAFASIGYATGIVAGNFEWYAFVFLLLLAMVFAPRYIASKVSTMPEYMGKRYGDSTQNILAWYALVKILVSWLSLGLFSGGILVRQILGIPMWQSVTVLVIFSGIFTFAGGLKAIAKVNVFQMILLIVVSLTLSYLGLQKVGGISALIAKTPSNFWNLVQPANDAHYPWPAIVLGYPVAAVAFFCTDQSMVQSVLGAKNLEQGQLGVKFLLSIFWKRTTKRAVNATLSWGSAFSLFVGVLYLWIFPADKYPVWPHFLLISFYIFATLLVSAIVISLTDKNPETTFVSETNVPKTSKKVKLLFGLLGLTIFILYFVFNGN